MVDIDYVAVGKRIRTARNNLKLTQAKLAEMIEVASSYISEIERGKSICSLVTIAKISKALNANLDNLIFGINVSNADSTFKELLKSIPEENQKFFIELCINIAKTFNKSK